MLTSTMIKISALFLSIFISLVDTTNYVYNQRLWTYYHRMSEVFALSPINDQIVFKISGENKCEIRDLHFVEKLGAYSIPDHLGQVSSLSWLPSSHIYMQGPNWAKLLASNLTPIIQVDLTELENVTVQFSLSDANLPIIAAKISSSEIRLFKNTTVQKINVDEFHLMSLDLKGEHIYLLNDSHIKKWSIEDRREQKAWSYSGDWEMMIGGIESEKDEVLLGSPFSFEISSEDEACQNQISQLISIFSFKFSQVHPTSKRVLATSQNKALLWETNDKECSNWSKMPVATFQNLKILEYGFGANSSVALFTSDSTFRIFMKVQEAQDSSGYLIFIFIICGIVLLSISIFLVCLFKEKKRREMNEKLLDQTKQEMVSQQIQTSFVSNKDSSKYYTQEIEIE